MNKIFEAIKNGLIVSCQAKGKEPLNIPFVLALLAKSAVLGGAVGIRAEGYDNVSEIVRNVNVPVIGLIKSTFPDKTVRITGRYKDVEKLLETKCHIIAIDGTFRKREKLTGPDFIEKIKLKYPSVLIMADISTFEEGLACINSGADCVSTTLSGYTKETFSENKGPDIKLLKKLIKKVPNYPIIAEGRYNTPSLAAKAIKIGAWSVVVGTAITRPIVITNWFCEAIKKEI